MKYYAPRPGECLSSFLARVVDEYGVAPADIQAAMGIGEAFVPLRKLERGPINFDSLSEFLDIPPLVLYGMTERALLFPMFEPGSQGRFEFGASPLTFDAHCPDCLAKSSAWPSAWLAPDAIGCSEHHLLLLRACSQCGANLRSYKQHRRLRNSCPDCGFPLACGERIEAPDELLRVDNQFRQAIHRVSERITYADLHEVVMRWRLVQIFATRADDDVSYLAMVAAELLNIQCSAIYSTAPPGGNRDISLYIAMAGVHAKALGAFMDARDLGRRYPERHIEEYADALWRSFGCPKRDRMFRIDDDGSSKCPESILSAAISRVKVVGHSRGNSSAKLLRP